jgi:hypothetical protein
MIAVRCFQVHLNGSDGATDFGIDEKLSGQFVADIMLVRQWDNILFGSVPLVVEF